MIEKCICKKDNIKKTFVNIQMSLDPIRDRVIFIFWTGTNEMSFRRIHCINALKEQTGARIELITVDNLPQWIIEDYPLHPAYPYLSETHKCDYLRTYFMYHYGGGYSDIKIPNGSWVRAFQTMEENPDIWVNGYPEGGPDAIAHAPSSYLWDKLPGNCAYIIRPKTAFVKAWIERQAKVLDEKYEQLKENPSTQPDCCIEYVPGTKYPLHWNELLGRIFHEEAAKITERIKLEIPVPDFNFYR
jgi:hypothetical protein